MESTKVYIEFHEAMSIIATPMNVKDKLTFLYAVLLFDPKVQKIELTITQYIFTLQAGV